MNTTTLIQPHGLACDGCGIAKDDLLAIETMEKQEECIHELFHNAARIHKAMRSNRLLRPIFRKYREACREILQTKKEEAEQFVRLSEYCDECGAHDPHQANEDLKYIQTEMREIHNQIKTKLNWNDDDSGSDCSTDCSESADDAKRSHDSSSVSSYSTEPESAGSESGTESGTESDDSNVEAFWELSKFT